jgi:tetratricopeptide (TPR) repeat protein
MVAFLIILCHLAVAEEANLSEARIFYDNGKMLFEEKRYENAIVAWQRSWEISQKPILLYNIALAYEEMEDYEQAIDFIYKYRSFAEPDEHPFLKEKIVTLEEKLKQQEQVNSVLVAAIEEDVSEVIINTESTETYEYDAKVSSKGPTRMYFSWGATAAFIGTSTTLGLLKNSVQHQYTNSECVSVQENQKTVFYCPPTEFENEDMQDIILREKNLMVATNIGWGLSIASASLSSWITVKYFSKPEEKVTSVWISNNMLGIAGEF